MKMLMWDKHGRSEAAAKREKNEYSWESVNEQQKKKTVAQEDE